MDDQKSVGTILREQRLAKKLSLEEVEKQTNIRAYYLAAIEQEDYSKTPGEVFVKGIIRSYGNFLGLDGDNLVTQYKAESSGRGVDEVRSAAIRETSKVKMNISLKQKRDWGTGNGFSLSNIELPTKQIAIGLVAVLVLVGLYFAVPKAVTMMKKAANKPEKTTTEVQKQAAKPAAPVLDKVTVLLEAQGDCWLEATADGKVIFSGNLQAKEKKELTAKSQLVIRYGNIGAVKVTVNGKAVAYPGETGVATKTYTLGKAAAKTPAAAPVQAPAAAGNGYVEEPAPAAAPAPQVSAPAPSPAETAKAAPAPAAAPAAKATPSGTTTKKAGGNR